nr:hypothetical protein [Tanacetum cinerariifolium]
FRLSQAQMLWGFYHRINIDFAYLTRKPSISRRNKINWHYVRDDVLFSTIKVVSRHQTTQQYGAILPIELITDEIRNSKAYKEYYACATGEAAPKLKASARKKKGDSAFSTTPPTPTPTTTIKSAPRLSATAKGTGSKPGVPDVPSDDSEEEISWNSSDDEDVGGHEEGNKSDESDDDRDEGSDDDSDETVKAGAGKDDDDNDDEDDDDNDEEEELAKSNEEDTESGKGGDEVRESEGESDEEETRQEEEESFNLIPKTPEESEEESNDEEDQDLRLSEEARIKEEEDADELYRDVNINQGRGLQVTQNVKDSYVTLTPVNPDGPQESSYMSSFVTSMLNLTIDVGVESIFTMSSSPIVSLQTPTPIMTPSTIATITTSSEAPIPPPTIPSIILDNLPMFNSAFRFEERLRSLEKSFSEYRQTNPFVDAVSAIPADLSKMELKKILIEKMEGNKSIQRSDEQQNLYKALVEAYDADKTTCQMEEPPHPVFETCADDQPIVQTSQHPDWFSQPRRPPSPDHAWNTTLPAAQGDAQSWISDLARQTDARSSFNELLETPIDFSNFIMHRLNVDTLTPDLLAGPTYELMRGSCTILTELEYHLEEVYKATTNQLDWVNPEGQQYPHNLLQPLPLIPDNRGRRVIPFEHFINNDLEYLRGGTSSRKYTTSVTKTKAADYGHIKWIQDLVPRAMWIQQSIYYNKHALWGVSYWRRKRKQFYGYAVNRESTIDVYSKRRIIAVSELKIVEWHDYKHLDWILVRRDDDKIYKFKEGDLKRLRLQDIEDMLLLLEHCHQKASGRPSTGS